MQKYNLHKGPLQVPRVSTILINQNWHVLEKNITPLTNGELSNKFQAINKSLN